MLQRAPLWAGTQTLPLKHTKTEGLGHEKPHKEPVNEPEGRGRVLLKEPVREPEGDPFWLQEGGSSGIPLLSLRFCNFLL